MLIYEGTKDNFLSSVEQDTIAAEIESNIYERMHRHTAKNKFRSWENSMEYMYKVLNDQDIPSDAGIAIEYNIPQTSKRVDFLISGYGEKEMGRAGGNSRTGRIGADIYWKCCETSGSSFVSGVVICHADQ